jgi:hypothetical protein
LVTLGMLVGNAEFVALSNAWKRNLKGDVTG